MIIKENRYDETENKLPVPKVSHSSLSSNVVPSYEEKLKVSSNFGANTSNKVSKPTNTRPELERVPSQPQKTYEKRPVQENSSQNKHSTTSTTSTNFQSKLTDNANNIADKALDSVSNKIATHIVETNVKPALATANKYTLDNLIIPDEAITKKTTEVVQAGVKTAITASAQEAIKNPPSSKNISGKIFGEEEEKSVSSNINKKSNLFGTFDDKNPLPNKKNTSDPLSGKENKSGANLVKTQTTNNDIKKGHM
jgi:hypothetical protein